MKIITILLITLSCFALFSYGYYSIAEYVNPNPYQIHWKQFSPDGTLVYSNSGIRLFIVGFLKSLLFSIPFSVILMVKLKFSETRFLYMAKTSFILNIFISVIGVIF